MSRYYLKPIEKQNQKGFGHNAEGGVSMNKNVYAIWLGDAWFTSASEECLQTTGNDLPITTFDNETDAVRTYNSAVNCGAVVHEEGNAIVRIKCERM